MSSRDQPSPLEPLPDAEDLAAQTYVRRNLGSWSEEEELELPLSLEQDPSYADAFKRIERSWAAVGRSATSPEVMEMREQAISRARDATARRWLGDESKRRLSLQIAAGLAAIGAALSAAYQLAPFGYRPGEYQTRLGEQRVVELEDRSRVAL